LESKSNFFLLIIVVAILTLALAALAGYLLLIQGAPQTNTQAGTKTVAQSTTIPKEDALTVESLFESKTYFNLKNDDSSRIAIIQVDVKLKCLKEFKENKKLVKVEEKISMYSDEIKELFVKFFLNITIDDVKNVAEMDKVKEELKKQINELLNEGQKESQDIVYKVIFSEWLFQ